jgi:hypothetical protein
MFRSRTARRRRSTIATPKRRPRPRCIVCNRQVRGRSGWLVFTYTIDGDPREHCFLGFALAIDQRCWHRWLPLDQWIKPGLRITSAAIL